MKKKDILKLLKYRRCLLEDEYVKRIESYYRTDKYGCPKKEDFPDIKELRDNFIIINNEFNKVRERRQKIKDYLQNNEEDIKKVQCDHSVVSGYKDLFGYHYHCVLCGLSDRNIKENSKRVCLRQTGDYNDEPSQEEMLADDADNIEKFNRFYSAVVNMLKDKDDEEEIDFTQEFNNGYELYNFGLVQIEEEKPKKHNVLVILGSNKIKVMDNIYLNKEVVFDNNLVYYFSKMNNLDVSYVSSIRGIDSYNASYYDTIDELNDVLIKQTEIDIVIDFSKLIDYKIINNSIVVSDISLDLNRIFPNSIIIQVKNIEDEIKLYERLRNIIIKGVQKVKKYE